MTRTAYLVTLLTLLMANLQNGGAQSTRGPSGNTSHMVKISPDERCFRKIEKFSNKREDWIEWKRHFLFAVRECDAVFCDWLLVHEKDDDVRVILGTASALQEKA